MDHKVFCSVWDMHEGTRNGAVSALYNDPRHIFIKCGGVRASGHRWLWREPIALLFTRAGPTHVLSSLPILLPPDFRCTPARACRESSCCRWATGAQPLLWLASVQALVGKPTMELAAAVEHAGEWPAGAGEEGRRR
jgi:hypothetical protein